MALDSYSSAGSCRDSEAALKLTSGPVGPHWSPLYGETPKNLHFFSTEESKTWTSWM